MDQKAPEPQKDASSRSVGRRLRDWWKGGQATEAGARRPSRLAKEEVVAWAGRGASEPDWRGLSQWSPGRLAAAELCWGKGSIRPESPDFARALTAPFDLEKVTSVCDLNCGPRGASTDIADVFAVRPGAYSRHGELVALSKHFAEGEAATQRLHVPAISGVGTQKVSALVAFDLVQAYVEKSHILEALRERLDDGGQFVFTDFACNASESAQAAISAWRQLEPELYFDAPAEHWRMCREQALEVEDMTDITEPYCELILGFMPRIKEQLFTVKRPQRTLLHLRYELELYARRLQALESGAARLLRYYGQVAEA